jgi:hypothetical protein
MMRLVCAALLLASTALAAEDDRPRIKVSLSPVDPNVRTGKLAKGEVIEFHLFAEGPKIRGVDFGMKVDGGEFLGFVPNCDDRTWQTLLIPNPYPGTICQAGMECYSSPCRLGKLIVRATKAGEKITADVIPSVHQQHALVMNCDYSTTNGLMGYPAAVNTAAPEPHPVDGVELVSKGWPQDDEESASAPPASAPADTTR